MTLRDLLADAASQLDDVATELGPGGGLTWSRAGRAFATVAADGTTAEFALDPAVAAAASRTPDVGRRRAAMAGSRSARPISTIMPPTGRSPGSRRPTAASARATDDRCLGDPVLENSNDPGQ